MEQTEIIMYCVLPSLKSMQHWFLDWGVCVCVRVCVCVVVGWGGREILKGLYVCGLWAGGGGA